MNLFARLFRRASEGLGTRVVVFVSPWPTSVTKLRHLHCAIAVLSGPHLLREASPVVNHMICGFRFSCCQLPSGDVRRRVRRSSLKFIRSIRLCCHGSGVPRRPSDYELSLGKIVTTLRGDYPAFFERRPDFGIYSENVVLELGKPFENVSPLCGKRAYSRALNAVQRLAKSMVRDGTVTCHISDGEPYGHAVRVYWSCHGELRGLCSPVHVSAVSLYSVAPQALSSTGDCPSMPYLVSRHVLEFVAMHPPSLRSLLVGAWSRTGGVAPTPAWKCR
eukprot:TRINITY_DN55405_c0_g1_i1.p1 TRINITY_DN55405_c0_g1~~TRINITY_DN55405_c0_g1_i1.p1  ORF type:complete len:276 (-),score=13.23 TRINITY_DN55405_c0_g1_i1:100-927(-)